jgi:hypothetical protein
MRVGQIAFALAVTLAFSSQAQAQRLEAGALPDTMRAAGVTVAEGEALRTELRRAAVARVSSEFDLPCALLYQRTRSRRRSGAPVAQRGAAACAEALAFRRDANPVLWAGAQDSLGASARLRATAAADLLPTSLRSFPTVWPLRYFTAARFPRSHAATSASLARVERKMRSAR